ncbi:MAG: RNA 2',3'-cyclic phosphodiesterase [Deltaproteobacteria bacterium]|jgi:2'-5' RNA ligase|nr:RNA 2',3'-cyclic phosphodiesterase [Deltaproteobacteria bacterium]
METEAPKAAKAPARARLFVAVEIPDRAAAKFVWLQGKTDELKDLAFRNLHVNVRFIGEVDHDLVPAATAALLSVSQECGPFTLTLKGLFVHPSANSHLLCARVDNHDPLLAIKNAVDKALGTVEGFPPAWDRQYKPSMLLGRLKGPPSERLQHVLDINRHKVLADFPVNDIHLFRSRLSPSGAVHTPLTRIPLQGPRFGKKTSRPAAARPKKPLPSAAPSASAASPAASSAASSAAAAATAAAPRRRESRPVDDFRPISVTLFPEPPARAEAPPKSGQAAAPGKPALSPGKPKPPAKPAGKEKRFQKFGKKRRGGRR